MITIADRLRQLREEHALSQEQFAVTMGVTRMTIAGYELSKRVPDADFILKACNYFDCTPDYLFGLTEFRNNNHYNEWVASTDTLMLALNLLPDEKRKEIVTALNWVLEDNFGVNTLTGNSDYLIDKFIGIILPFTHLFKDFIKTLQSSNSEIGIPPTTVLSYLKSSEDNRTQISNVVNSVSNDLLGYLFAQDEKAIKTPSENQN